MTQPLAVQLYSVRDQLASDYLGTLRQIAAMGYLGVEMAGAFYHQSPRETVALCRDLGLTIAAAHAPLPLGDQQAPTLDMMATLGAQAVVCAYIPPEELSTVDDIRRHSDRLNQADEIARASGLTLYYHNHWWEYQRVDGTGEYVYRIMHQHLNPTVHYEIDAYWVQVGGLAPVEVLRELGDRVTLLHVKDGPGASDQPMLAVGSGVMDYSAIIPAAAKADWLVVELDRCATDMIEAVRSSAAYLHGRQLGRLRG